MSPHRKPTKRPTYGGPEAARYLAWIREGLQKPGKTPSGLGRALGISVQGGHKLADGRRAVKAHELDVISRYLESPAPMAGIKTPVTVPTLFTLDGRMWFEAPVIGAMAQIANGHHHQVPAVPDARYAALPQFAALVADDSIDLAIRPGMFAICVPYAAVRDEPADGDLVAVQISRRGLYKPTILRMAATNNHWELQTHSSSTKTAFRLSPDLKKNNLNGDEIEFLGLVIGKYGLVGEADNA